MPTTSERPTLDPVWTPPVQQACYRALIEAIAYPGRVHDLAQRAAGASARIAALAAIVDGATTLADPDELIDAEARRFLDVGSAGPDQAAFVILDGRRPPPQRWHPALGTLTSPERGATLLVCCEAIGPEARGDLRWHLRGPGIAESATLTIDGLDPGWATARGRWCAGCPCGVDLVLCDPRRIAAVPRHTTLEQETA